MIYFLIFLYLLYLSIHFDILERKGARELHWLIALTLLILVAGLRWRIGSDTVIYAREFYDYPDIFHLTGADFESTSRMPLWVLLNSVCKTIWNDFVLFQFVVAFLSISISGFFVKETCPSLRFFILLCYYIGGKYTGLHMELLRESLAVSFSLLALLSFDQNKIIRSILYGIVAVLFHVFAIVPILLFILIYYFLPQNRWIHAVIYSIMLVLTIFAPRFFVSIAETYSVLLGGVGDGSLESTVITYAASDEYGSTDKSFFQYIVLLCNLVAYLFMFFKFQNRYKNYFQLKQSVFEAGFFIFISMLICRFSFVILYRIGTSYFYFIGCSLSVAFTKILLSQIKKKQVVMTYLFMLNIPFAFSLSMYTSPDLSNNSDTKWYTRYYPYCSVFEKKFNSDREKLHQARGAGYMKSLDY